MRMIRFFCFSLIHLFFNVMSANNAFCFELPAPAALVAPATQVAPTAPANAAARLPLPEFEAKLYHFILSSQLSETTEEHLRGSWHIYSRILGTPVEMQENNSFLMLQLMNALHEIALRFHLPMIDQILERANTRVEAFLSDARVLGDPDGTINYWPILDEKTGRRGATNLPPLVWTDEFNIPNDFDASAQAFLWLNATNRHPKYREAFIQVVGQFTDLNRARQHRNDHLWKNMNSGAFLTWAEGDLQNDPKTRVPIGKINDVDCVVNLNILSALGNYERQMKSRTQEPFSADAARPTDIRSASVLPPQTEQGKLDSCQVIRQALQESNVPKCAVWYDRVSQFALAFAKAHASGIQCLQDSLHDAREVTLKEAFRLSNRTISHLNGTEVAEILIALKTFFPPDRRPIRILTLMNRLELRLRTTIAVDKRRGAYVKTEDDLYKADRPPFEIRWYSKAMSTILALQALTLP